MPPPKVVEVVGLPATGKTTLTRALVGAGAGHLVRLRGPRVGPLLVRNAFRLALPFVAQAPRMGGRRWNRYSMMVRLDTLGDLVSSSGAGEADLLLLDQGPVYMLSILQRARSTLPSSRNSRRFETYWERTTAGWSRRLDVVVELDADDEILRRRILDRGTPNPAGEVPAEAALRYLERSRQGRARILSGLQAGEGGPDLLRLRTDRLSVEEAVERILTRVRELPSSSR